MNRKMALLPRPVRLAGAQDSMRAGKEVEIKKDEIC